MSLEDKIPELDAWMKKDPKKRSWMIDLTRGKITKYVQVVEVSEKGKYLRWRRFYDELTGPASTLGSTS